MKDLDPLVQWVMYWMICMIWGFEVGRIIGQMLY